MKTPVDVLAAAVATTQVDLRLIKMRLAYYKMLADVAGNYSTWEQVSDRFHELERLTKDVPSSPSDPLVVERYQLLGLMGVLHMSMEKKGA